MSYRESPTCVVTSVFRRMHLHEQSDTEDAVMEVFLLTLGKVAKLCDDLWYSFRLEFKMQKASLCLAVQQRSWRSDVLRAQAF